MRIFDRLCIAMVLAYYECDISHVPPGGKSNRIRCPFHDDSHPSASVDRERQYFTCHACGVRGDGIDLIMQREGLAGDYASAFAFAREYMGYRRSGESGQSKPARRKPYRSPWSDDAPASEWCENCGSEMYDGTCPYQDDHG